MKSNDLNNLNVKSELINYILSRERTKQELEQLKKVLYIVLKNYDKNAPNGKGE